MFLDTFMENASESNVDLADAQLECAVSLEAAYNDVMLEMCQLKYQSLIEGVDVINEGVIESIKNFFKKLLNAIKKFFGISSSDSSSGGGASRQSIDKLKKQLDNNNRITKGIKFIMDNPELSKRFTFIDYENAIIADSIINDEYLHFALEKAEKTLGKLQEEFKKNSHITINSDEIALDTLRTFLKVSLGNKIDVEKINSLDDFKKALYDHISYISLNDLFGKINLDNLKGTDHVIRAHIDKLSQEVDRAYKYEKTVEKQMQRFENDITMKGDLYFPQFPSVIGKIANNLAQACIISATYTRKITDKFYREILKLISAAMTADVKED